MFLIVFRRVDAMDDELSVLFDTRHLNILRSLNKRVETRQKFPCG